MDKGYAALMAYVLFFYLLSRINIYIILLYRRSGADDCLTVHVKLLRNLIVYSITIPVVEIIHKDFSWFVSEVGTDNEKTRTQPKRERRFVKRMIDFYIRRPHRVRRLIQIFRYYKKVYRYFMDQLFAGIHCELFHWHTRFGFEDAAITGISNGAIWALKELILVNLHRQVTFDNRPNINVVPVFGQTQFETELKCIFRLKLGNVMSVSTRLYNYTRKEAVSRG